MSWGLLLTTTLAVVGIALTIVLSLKLNRIKRPTLSFDTETIIGIGSDAPPGLQLSFNGRPVTQVHRTKFIFFNRGKEPLRKDDVTKKVNICFQDAQILREPMMKMISNPENQIQAQLLEKSLIELEFLYLDHEDGAVVEVIHTPYKKITYDGNIIGTKGISLIRWAEPIYVKYGTIRNVVSIVFLIAIALVVLMMTVENVAQFFNIEKDIPGWIFIVLFVVYLVVAPDVNLYQYFSLKRFPVWSKKNKS